MTPERREEIESGRESYWVAVKECFVEIDRLKDESRKIVKGWETESGKIADDEVECWKKLVEARDFIGSILNHLNEGEEDEAKQVAHAFFNRESTE